MEPMEIRANFKQATVKGGTAVLQLDYDEEDEGEPLPFDRPANVDAETGEVYEVITDEARMIGDGE